MSDPNDRLEADLPEIETQSGTRSARIRKIVQTAAAEVITELKAGIGEISATANQSSSTATPTPSPLETPSTVLDRNWMSNQVKGLLVNLDAKLANRWGHRYATVKQRLEQFRIWYDNSKANAAANGVNPVQQKQAEIELKIADQGVFVARKEQQIRQQVKQFFSAAIRTEHNTDETSK